MGNGKEMESEMDESWVHPDFPEWETETKWNQKWTNLGLTLISPNGKRKGNMESEMEDSWAHPDFPEWETERKWNQKWMNLGCTLISPNGKRKRNGIRNGRI